MGRRRKGGLEEVASLPWPLGIAAGVIAFFVIRYGIGAVLSAGGPILATVGQQMGTVLASLAWIAMLGCWLAAGVSWLNSRQRRSLHDTRSDLDSLSTLSWQEFEILVGESYRRQGYQVVENGLGGKDGGIDLILAKDGRRELVQCKHWRRRQVNAATVREMWGLVSHHGADAVHIVSVGDFTSDARQFARGKPIYLVTGRELLERIRTAKGAHDASPPRIPADVPEDPKCPLCSAHMTERRNRKTGQRFLGCSQFPRCRGTVAIET